MLPVSGKTQAALQRNVQALGDHFKRISSDEFGDAVAPRGNDPTKLASIAATLQKGREAFEYRTSVVASSLAGAARTLATTAAALESSLDGGVAPNPAKKEPGVVLMFPGQGSQYLNMGRGLYGLSPVFTEHIDTCAEILAPLLGGRDIRTAIFPADDVDPDEAADRFSAPTTVQPALFAVEYSLAQVLLELGVQPIAVAGHSIGEYVAATMAGVLTLQQALTIVALRATSTETECPPGGMIAVRMEFDKAFEAVNQYNEGTHWQEAASGVGKLSVAAGNSPVHQVISGPSDQVAHMHAQLTAAGIRSSQLHVTHGFHSKLMSPAADKIQAFIDALDADGKPSLPKIPMTSNVTGLWLNDEAADGEYWADHMTGTVKWAENVKALLKWQPDVLIEVGPGSTLCTLSLKTASMELADGAASPAALSSMRHPKATDVDDAFALSSLLGKLWSAGVALDWSKLRLGSSGANNLQPRTYPWLPTYSWEKTSYWVAPHKSIYVKVEDGGGIGNAAIAASTAVATELAQGAPAAAARQTLVPESPLLVRYGAAKLPEAVRLYCFPYAGGSSANFESWAAVGGKCPAWLDVVAVEPPGRGGRADETRASDDEGDAAEVSALAAAIEADSANAASIVLCGMSMGVLTAVEVARSLSIETRAKLRTFVAAGRAPPASTDGDTPPDLEGLNLAPAAVIASEMWEGHFKPLLEADLAADSRAAKRLAPLMVPPAAERAGEHVSGAAASGRLDANVLIFCGDVDPSFPMEAASTWRNVQKINRATHASEDDAANETAGTLPLTFGVQYLPGAHSFLTEQADTIFNGVVEQLLSSELGSQRQARAPGSGPKKSVLHSVKWVSASSPAVTHTKKKELKTAHHQHTSSNDGVDEMIDASVEGAVCFSDAPEYKALGIKAATKASASAPQEHAAFSAEQSALLASDSGLIVVAGCEGNADDSEEACQQFVGLLQAIVETGAAGRLVLVLPAAVDGAMLSGVSKSFALEYPDVVCQRIFYGSGLAGSASQARLSSVVELQGLVKAGLQRPTETDIWFRNVGSKGSNINGGGQGRHRRRKRRSAAEPWNETPLVQQIAAWEHAALEAPDKPVLSVEDDDVYLITGGKGFYDRLHHITTLNCTLRCTITEWHPTLHHH